MQFVVADVGVVVVVVDLVSVVVVVSVESVVVVAGLGANVMQTSRCCTHLATNDSAVSWFADAQTSSLLCCTCSVV